MFYNENRLKMILMLVMALLFYSCSEDKKDRWEVYHQYKKEMVNNLSIKYNISSLLDTVHYNFSYQFEDIISTDLQLIESGSVQDIFIRNDVYYADIRANSDSPIYLELKLQDKPKKYLLNYLNQVNESYVFLYDAVFVVKLEKVKKVKLGIDCYFECDEYENFSYIDIDLPTSFIGFGELIDVKLRDETKVKSILAN